MELVRTVFVDAEHRPECAGDIFVRPAQPETPFRDPVTHPEIVLAGEAAEILHRPRAVQALAVCSEVDGYENLCLRIDVADDLRLIGLPMVRTGSPLFDSLGRISHEKTFNSPVFH